VKRLSLKSISLVAATTAFAATFFGLIMSNAPESEAVVKATDFKAGRIIDDSIFYNADTMTVEQIQAHLDSYSPSCDFWGTGPVGGGRSINGRTVPSNTTRREYARMKREAGNSNYHDAPYVCVNKYYENPETHETLYETNGEIKPGMISAAQIIYNAAKEYNINPQVLLVLLKKESYVWGDNWPLKWEYNTVMGYACPDGAPCDSKYFGFYNQVKMAAWQLNYYKSHIYSYNYRPYETNQILYSPDWSCGRKAVYLENIATTSLYIYTPYTPNDAALTNYPGTSYCGSYGNRNFFMYFAEWFGSPIVMTQWTALLTPRFLTTTKDVQKKNLAGSSTTTIPANTTFYFSTKSDSCLRTDSDTNKNVQECIEYEDLKEAEWEWGTMLTPRYMMAKADAKLIDLSTNQAIGDAPKVAYYDQKTNTGDGKSCLRIEGEMANQCVLWEKLDDFVLEKKSMLMPRMMENVDKSTYFVNPNGGARMSKFNSATMFDSAITTPGGMYVCRKDGLGCVPYDKTKEAVINLETPRDLVVKEKTNKHDYSKLKLSNAIAAGKTMRFTKKTYYRSGDAFFLCLITEDDARIGKTDCFDRNALGEVLVEFQKSEFEFAKDGYKNYYDTGEVNRDNPVQGGQSRYFLKKTYIPKADGEVEDVCYLTEFDVLYDSRSCTSESLLIISQ